MLDLPLSSPFIPADASMRLRDLIGHSVERILAKDKDDAFLNAESIRHIIDWLVVADQQDATWIHRLDARGVPVKLAKCGSLDRLHLEADKAMRRETQRAMARLDPAQAGEGEEIEMTLDDGWTIVRLLTPEALDRESARMGHCVGNGAYDGDVTSGQSKIFSLRCSRGKSHVTVEIGRNIQIKGRSNSHPDKKHVEVFHKLFVLYEKEPEYWMYVALDLKQGRIEHAESIISTHPQSAKYAFFLMGTRWPEAEPAIAKHPYCAYEYAKSLVQHRWPAGEAAIVKNPETAQKYARDVIGGRWPEAEPVIAQDPVAACFYAEDAIGGRFLEGEDAIAQHSTMAQRYAVNVLKARWPEAEPIIATHPFNAWFYAQEVMKARWPEGEPAIATDAHTAQKYAEYVIKARWPEAEPIIATQPSEAVAYAQNFMNQRWPEAETAILTDGLSAALYAEGIIKGFWPEAEEIISSHPDAAYFYEKMIIDKGLLGMLNEKQHALFPKLVARAQFYN